MCHLMTIALFIVVVAANVARYGFGEAVSGGSAVSFVGGPPVSSGATMKAFVLFTALPRTRRAQAGSFLNLCYDPALGPARRAAPWAWS